MKHNALFFIAIVLMSMAVGCVSENDIPQRLKTPQSNSMTISAEQALESLLAFLNRTGQTTRAEGFDMLDVEVVSSRQITRSYGGEQLPPIDSLLYVVNFDNDSGYAILSADQRIGTPIIAVTEAGSIDMQQFGLGAVDDELQTGILIGNGENPTIGGQFINDLIVEFINGRLDDGYNYVGGDYTYTPPTSPYTVPPILTTIWGQWSPYNSKCPMDDGVQTPAGCVAVATGQVIAHFGKGDFESGYNYEWGIIRSVGCIGGSNGGSYSNTQIEQVSTLLKEIGDMCCMDYAADGSQTMPWKVRDCLSEIGYSDVDFYWGYDINDITTSLLRGIPVIISAGYLFGGHTWVIDGFDNFAIENDDDVLVHCNWGWSGKSNGFYYSKVFDVSAGAVITDGAYGDVFATKDANYNVMFSTVLIEKI